MSAGQLTNFRRYAYDSPVTAINGGPPRFWVVRSDVIGDPSRPKGRTFYWEVPNPAQPWRWRSAFRGHPAEFGVPFRDCLYNAGPLGVALRSLPPLIVWAEGEPDADTARRVFGVPATTHYGGAQAATPEQAAHFAPLATAKGRKAGTRVLLVADRDDAGYAGALVRYRLLRDTGLSVRQIKVVRPADGVLSGGGGCGAVPCRCEPDPCPLPSEQWKGADLTDHADAGYGLRDLVRVPIRDLRAAAERTAARQQQGWVYGQPENRSGRRSA